MYQSTNTYQSLDEGQWEMLTEHGLVVNIFTYNIPIYIHIHSHHNATCIASNF